MYVCTSPSRSLVGTVYLHTCTTTSRAAAAVCNLGASSGQLIIASQSARKPQPGKTGYIPLFFASSIPDQQQPPSVAHRPPFHRSTLPFVTLLHPPSSRRSAYCNRQWCAPLVLTVSGLLTDLPRSLTNLSVSPCLWPPPPSSFTTPYGPWLWYVPWFCFSSRRCRVTDPSSSPLSIPIILSRTSSRRASGPSASPSFWCFLGQPSSAPS